MQLHLFPLALDYWYTKHSKIDAPGHQEELTAGTLVLSYSIIYLWSVMCPMPTVPKVLFSWISPNRNYILEDKYKRLTPTINWDYLIYFEKYDTTNISMFKPWWYHNQFIMFHYHTIKQRYYYLANCRTIPSNSTFTKSNTIKCTTHFSTCYEGFTYTTSKGSNTHTIQTNILTKLPSKNPKKQSTWPYK